MTERQRRLFAWAVLALFALLAGYIVSSILSPIVGWLTTVLLEIIGALGLPAIFSAGAMTVTRFLMIAARCAAIGFAYRVFFDDPWRKAGLRAWAVVVAWNTVPAAFTRGPEVLAYPLTSAWFWTDTAVSGAAALAGAWYAFKHRHNQHVHAVRDGLFRALRID